jgi:hypothetical protein
MALTPRRQERDSPDPSNPVQATFLQAMSALERIAGGPVYLGVDTVLVRTPEIAPTLDVDFSLPLELDAGIRTARGSRPCSSASDPDGVV